MYCIQYFIALELAKRFRKAMQDDPYLTLLRTMHAFNDISACQQLRWS